MGTLSTLCELRGRAPEGKGCTLVAGLRYCAKRSGGLSTTMGDDCTTLDVDVLNDGGTGSTVFFSDPFFSDPFFRS